MRYGNGKMLLGSYVQHPASDLLSGTFTKWEAPAIPESPEPDPNAARAKMTIPALFAPFLKSRGAKMTILTPFAPTL